MSGKRAKAIRRLIYGDSAVDRVGVDRPYVLLRDKTRIARRSRYAQEWIRVDARQSLRPSYQLAKQAAR